VISLAILADEDPNWRPSNFGYARWRFRAGIEFPIVKLLDYAPHWQAPEANPNPFAMVVLAHLKTLETRQSPVDRQLWKVRLIKGLYERGLQPEDVRRLFRFIDWMMDLPSTLDKLFWEEIRLYEEGHHMPFMTTPERIGRTEGLLEGIEQCLELKFGEAGLQLMPEVLQLTDVEQLRAVLQAIKSAANPEALRRVWTS
jgi:hypothetical protein